MDVTQIILSLGLLIPFIAGVVALRNSNARKVILTFIMAFTAVISGILVVGNLPIKYKTFKLDDRFILLKEEAPKLDNPSNEPPTRTYGTNMTVPEVVSYFKKLGKPTVVNKVLGYIPLVNIFTYKEFMQYGESEESYVLMDIQYPIGNEVDISAHSSSLFKSKYNYPTEVSVSYSFPETKNWVSLLGVQFVGGLIVLPLLLWASKAMSKELKETKEIFKSFKKK